MKKIYARAEEVVTCENGHQICVISKDIFFGESHDPADFTDWTQEEPEIGGAIPSCKICNADFYSNDLSPTDHPMIQLSAGPRLHFENGWR